MERTNWNGATRQLKAQLRSQVNEATYEDIERAAHAILKRLPHGYQLGTLTAGLMLAATAYAESAPHARHLISEREG